MHDGHRDTNEGNLPRNAWLLILVCAVAVVFALTGGAAYAGIGQARMAAAKASLGQIESTFLMAEQAAAAENLAPPADGVESLLQSYASEGELNAYEQFTLNAMLDAFGPERDFDFAISRFADAAGIHTSILYFPTKGRTNIQKDRYYSMVDNNVTEHN